MDYPNRTPLHRACIALRRKMVAQLLCRKAGSAAAATLATRVRSRCGTGGAGGPHSECDGLSPLAQCVNMAEVDVRGDETTASRLGAILCDEVAHGRVPGLAAAIVTGTGLLAAAAAGRADVRRGTPMRCDTPALWFSMTKVATATLTMRVIGAGQVGLDTPVRDVLGARTPMSWGHRVHIRHLLSHSGGVRNPFPLRWVHPAASDHVDLDAFVDRLLARHGRLRFEPGTRGRYSNLGMLVLGAVLETVTGTAFDDLMRSEILGPLEMSATGFASPTGGQSRNAPGPGAGAAQHRATPFGPLSGSRPVLRRWGSVRWAGRARGGRRPFPLCPRPRQRDRTHQ
jgi:CubicO group peptidase (beta-lactamase class C family)